MISSTHHHSVITGTCGKPSETRLYTYHSRVVANETTGYLSNNGTGVVEATLVGMSSNHVLAPHMMSHLLKVPVNGPVSLL